MVSSPKVVCFIFISFSLLPDSFAWAPVRLRPLESKLHLNTRRQWLGETVASLSVPFVLPSDAVADTRTVVSTASVCDPTVSVWKHNNRLERSAQLADRLVRDVHPDGIFVELDLKRAGGVPRQAENVSQNKFSMLEEGSAVPRDVVVPVLPTTLPRAAVASPDVPPALPESKAPKKQGFFDGMREKALAASANVVGGALKGMYQNLGDNGFRPGEEFAAAVRAGSADNAAIILGDQDVEVTLRRLTQAMAVTDLSKLNDASVQSRFSEIMPGGADTMPTGSMNVQDKEVLTTFVEEIKSRENVRALMKELKEVAPAMVQAMLTERDAYMAAGIDTLNEYECIVAVMGIAHIDGVENNLRTAGWTSVSPKCRVS